MSEWRDIPGYEGLYQVSDIGEVRRVANSPKCKTVRVLVPQGRFWVNHRNGIKNDNRLVNLEYLTPGQNLQHAYDTGLCHGPVGEKNGNAKLTEATVREIRDLFRAHPKPRRADIWVRFNISKTALSDALDRRSWREVE